MDVIQLGLFGKTYPEPFLQIKDWTFKRCSKRSVRPKFQCLLLGDGQAPEWFEAEDVMSHGESWMPNFGESPNVERESFLSQILEDNVPQKYYLSPKACQGILRRAERRGKKLPPLLEKALSFQASQEPLPQDMTAARA